MTREEAIKELRSFIGQLTEGCQEAIKVLIPELKESEDERIRKDLIKYLESDRDCQPCQDVSFYDSSIAWLEKQGNIDFEAYENAEKEKYDFVSGKFIECRKSFNEFKEDNSYWFEYVGNDTYIGRSDNILNKKFHITPRQLYRLFTQEHCPKEDSVSEGNKECLNLPHFTFDDVLALQCCMETVKKVQKDEKLYEALLLLHDKVHDAYHFEKQKKQKPVEWSDTDNIGWDEAFACVTRAEKAAKNEEELQNAVTAEKWLKEIKSKYYVHPVKQEWSEDDKFKLEDAITGIDVGIGFYETEGKHPNLLKAIIEAKDWLKSLPERFNLQPKQGWNGDDNVLLNNIINIIQNKKYVNDDAARKIYVDFLKSLRPQPKVEWSEDDKHRCKDAIYFLETAKKHYADTSEIELTIDWLKSLRPQSKVEEEPVDLEKEIDKTVSECANGYNFDWERFALHFYKLGLNNTRKEK